MTLDKLKMILDEENFPFFEEEYLEERVEEINSGASEKEVVSLLLEIKSGIPEFEVCGMKIPSPENYFLRRLKRYRTNYTGYIDREDR